MYESTYIFVIKFLTFLNVLLIFFQYITVHIDVNLQNQDYSEKILSEIQATDAKYKIESNSTVLNSVTWSRQIVNSYLSISRKL